MLLTSILIIRPCREQVSACRLLSKDRSEVLMIDRRSDQSFKVDDEVLAALLTIELEHVSLHVVGTKKSDEVDGPIHSSWGGQSGSTAGEAA